MEPFAWVSECGSLLLGNSTVCRVRVHEQVPGEPRPPLGPLCTQLWPSRGDQGHPVAGLMLLPVYLPPAGPPPQHCRSAAFGAGRVREASGGATLPTPAAGPPQEGL